MVALAMVMAFVVVTALLRRPSQPVAADVQPEPLVQSSELASVPEPAPAPDVAPRAAATAVAPGGVSKAPAKASVLKPEKSRITEADGPRAAVTAIAAALGTEDSTTQPAASESINAEPVSLDSEGPGAATITGCLETDGTRFRLTDTEGSDAPRSRNWRTGFLKKRSTAVALVEPPDPGALHTQVGQRVAATGGTDEPRAAAKVTATDWRSM